MLHPLQEIMLEKGLKQSDVAEALGYSAKTIVSHTVNGVRYPDPKLVALLTELGYNPEEFLTKHEEYTQEMQRIKTLSRAREIGVRDRAQVEEAATLINDRSYSAEAV